MEPNRPERLKRPNKTITVLLTVIILLLIYLGAALFRVHADTDPEFYEARNPVAFYWTENAVQYHYAELVSQGQPIPAFDPKLQAPEGVKVFENLTILMEYPCGALYRLLGLAESRIRFHTFTIYFMALFAGLTVFAIYGCGRALGFSRPYALLAAGLGVFSYVGIGRSIQGFLNEDFSLPLFFLGLAFFLNALRAPKGPVRDALLAGFFFGLSLAGWHFARFLFLGLVACVCLNLWCFTRDPKARRRQADVLLWMTVFPLLAGLIAPVLRSRGFFIAPAFILAWGAVLGSRLFPDPLGRPAVVSGRGWRQIGFTLALVAVSVALSRLMKFEADYTHVWSLLWNKLKFFGVKPAIPGQIDFPARSLWIEAFNSPSPKVFLLEFFPLIAAAAAGVFYGLRRNLEKPGIRLVLILSAVFFAAYLGIERLGLVANFFIALLAAGLGLAASKGTTRIRRFVPAVVLAAVLAFNFYQGYRIHDPTGYVKTLNGIFGPDRPGLPNWRVNNLDLVSYVRHEQPKTANFLARYSVGPTLFAYAGQAIALQPKFEVRGSRERVAEYYRGIYGSEEDLYNLCRRWRIDFFLYDLRILLDAGRDSDRWVADRLAIGKDCAAFLLHFAPEILRHFELVYQNSNYRMYRVLTPGETPEPRVFPPSAVYDLKEYGNQVIDHRPFDDQGTTALVERMQRAFRLIEHGQTMLGSEPSTARRLLLQARELYPNLIGEATVLGTAEVLLGRVKEGLELCRREVANNPYFALARYNLAYALYRNDDYEATRTELDQCLFLDPDFEPAREMRRELDTPD